MHYLSTQAKRNLTDETICRWARAIWYQPGATLSVDGGSDVPITRRLLVFSGNTRITVRGRAVFECGGPEDRLPGAADIAQTGPRFQSATIRATLAGAAFPTFIVPGSRTIKIDRIEMLEWSAAVEFYWSFQRFWYNSDVKFASGAGGANNLDPDDAVLGGGFTVAKPAPGVGLSVVIGANPLPVGGVQVTSPISLAAGAIYLSSRNIQPKDANFHDNGPVGYPLTPVGDKFGPQANLAFAGSSALGSGFTFSVGGMGAADYLDFQIFGHEEIF